MSSKLVTVTLPSEYGYVIAVGVASTFLLFYLGGQVGSARKRLGVPLPSLYADQEVAKKDKDKELFNCYQRSHQNTLEGYAQFLMMLFVGGVKHPLISTGAGVIWIIGRLLYAQGYQTGDPSKRQRGAIGYLGLLTLLGATISTALSLLGHLKWE